MIKNIVVLISLIIIALFFLYHSFQTKERGNTTKKNLLSTVPTSEVNSEQNQSSASTQSIFVPYWTLGSKLIETQEYDEVIYFGVTPDKNGIDKAEAGYTRINKFSKLALSSKKQLLAIRMLNSSFNSALLEDVKSQNLVITDAVAIAKKNGFEGVVLDFELSALSFPSVIEKITKLHQGFAIETKKNNLLFYTALYGDVFYRGRPYDVAAISHLADRVMILAYDFHKARENPGPNFPFKGKKIYKYDFVSMIDDFLKVIPKDKIVVVFGMFGYDWKTYKDPNTASAASSLSLNQLKGKFIDKCELKECAVLRDELSSEMTASYIDEEGTIHKVWFEDEESVRVKQQFLKTKGVNSFSYWAYSYF